MSGGKEEPLGLSDEAALLQQNGDLAQCVARLRLLQRRLTETDRWQLSPSVLWGLCGIIQGEAGKWGAEGAGQPAVSSLKVVSGALCCLRNALPNCARNQLMLAETEELLKSILSCIQWTFKAPEAAHTSAEPSPDGRAVEAEEGEGSAESEWRTAHHTLASSCVTCLGNLVAANSKTRRIVWPYINPLLEDVLLFPDKEVAQAACMILHNCLLEADLKEELCMSSLGQQVLTHLLTLYETETKFSCFVLLSLEVLLAGREVLAGAWGGLSEGHQRLVLEVVEARLTHSAAPHAAPDVPPSLEFLVAEFKSKADCILRTHADTDWMNPGSAQVLARLGTFVCASAASDTWRQTLQRDRSLLVTSVALLRCISDIGKMGGNAFTPLDRLSDLSNEEQMARAEGHPAFGFKCDLIRLIASLVYRNSANQDLVREMDGLLLVLESSKFDARNPLIKEASIFALRNLLEGNIENQQRIKELRMEGVVESPGLAELGMEAVEEGGKVKLLQRPRSSSSPPPEL